MHEISFSNVIMIKFTNKITHSNCSINSYFIEFLYSTIVFDIVMIMS